MNIRGGAVRKRKRRRKKKKKGGGLIGASSKTWTPAYLSGKRGSGLFGAMLNPIGALGGAALRLGGYRPKSRFAGARQKIRNTLQAVHGRMGGKRGSGMSFHGAGMAIHGAGLRGKRVLPRYGRGKRRV
jgi:hypothetical protein